MKLRLFFLTAFISQAATLTVTLPPYIATCPNGFAVATLNWSGATGPVQIRVGSATGPAMTAFTNPNGIATTGNWVTDGLAFFLVDPSGTVQASAAANFNCGGTPRTIDQGLASASYFPLAAGNTWVYKHNSRFATNSYTTWSITGTQTVNGQTYYALTQTVPAIVPPDTGLVALLRSGANGVIYQNTNSGDVVVADPSSQTAPYIGALGRFNNAISGLPISYTGELSISSATYVRGLGMASLTYSIDEGSNGGFSDSLDLVDVRVDGVHLSLPAPKIGLAIETTSLDLTDQLAPNCAVPCYFAACGIAPGPHDPPGFYRPCAQIRVDTSAAGDGETVLTQLMDASNTPVYIATSTIFPSAGEMYLSMPLYSSPFATSSQLTFFPPGNYTLLGTILNGTTTVATSSIAVEIR